MMKNKIKFIFVAVLCFVLLLMPIPIINAHAEGIDEPERTQNDESAVINPADEMPDSNADKSPDVVIDDEDVPLGDDVNQDNVANVWLIVGISVGAVAVLAVVVAIIVNKSRTKIVFSFSK